jgi:hypothetical protein
MNNNDYFNQAVERGNYLEAARLAIGFGRGKGSRSGAWSWATEAVTVAAIGGVTLDTGRLSWPDFDRMIAALPESLGNRRAGAK